MEAVETKEQTTEQSKGTVKITICKSLSGIAEGAELVYISRLRKGLSSDKVINFWVVGDNLLKGAALNAVQIGKYVLGL